MPQTRLGLIVCGMALKDEIGIIGQHRDELLCFLMVIQKHCVVAELNARLHHDGDDILPRLL